MNDILANYRNLKIFLKGETPVTEWGEMRLELRSLLAALKSAQARVDFLEAELAKTACDLFTCRQARDKQPALPSECQGVRDAIIQTLVDKLYIGRPQAWDKATDAILALLRSHGWMSPDDKGTIAEWFSKGQESVLRKNQSGCCCKIDDSDNVLSVCGAHQQWLEDTVAAKETPDCPNAQWECWKHRSKGCPVDAAQETPWVVERPCPNCVGAFAESEPGYPKSNRKWWPKCPECKGTGKLIRRLTPAELGEWAWGMKEALNKLSGNVYINEFPILKGIIDKALSIGGCPIRKVTG